MKIRMFVFLIVIAVVSGCAYANVKSRIASEIIPSYVSTAQRVNDIAPNFTNNWDIVSGIIQGDVNYNREVSGEVQEIVDRLDSLHIKAKDGSWTPRDKGAMVSLVVDLEIKAGQYLDNKYGITDMIRQLILSW